MRLSYIAYEDVRGTGYTVLLEIKMTAALHRVRITMRFVQFYGILEAGKTT